jgi:dTDP-4-dehydrorhamnose 3,5-epimerase
VIEGVILKPLRTIADERGAVLKMQESTDEEFAGFGEVYFSTVYPGVVKGWHLHEANVLNYSVVRGAIKLVLFDDREGSPTRGELAELFLDDRDRWLVQIPAGVWNGFMGLGDPESVVCDLTTLPHAEDVMQRHDARDRDFIDYDWDREDR